MPARNRLTLVGLLLSAVTATAQTGDEDVLKTLKARKVAVERDGPDGERVYVTVGRSNTADDLRLVGGCRGLYELAALGVAATDADLTVALAGSAKSLRSLGFEGAPFTDRVMPAVAGLTGLESLHIGRCKVTNAGLSHVGALPALRWVKLEGEAFTDDGLRHLARLPNLRGVTLTQTRVTGTGFAALADSKTLWYVKIKGSVGRQVKVTEAGLRAVGACKGLTELWFEHALVPDAGLAHLAELPRLEELVLKGCAVGDAGVKHVARSQTMRLDLTESTVGDAGMKHVARSRVMVLDLTDTMVGDTGMKHLAACPSLGVVRARRTPVTDAGLAALAACERLRTVDVSGSKVTPAGVAAFEEARPGCRVITDR
ncbi:hypothetical protein J0H58_06270 [bacterium]|nr:hypothetical protein [bacterium]